MKLEHHSLHFLVLTIGTLFLYSPCALAEVQCGSYSNNCQCGDGTEQCFRIEENSPIGTCLGNLANVSNIHGNLDSSRPLNFQLNTGGSICSGSNLTGQDLFNITNASLGTFTTKQEIDYEDLYGQCAMTNCLQLSIMVNYADDTSGSATSLVLLDIVNINDNPPIFNSAEYHRSVSETDTLNDHLFCCTDLVATDKDGLSNSEITYKVLPPSTANFSVSINVKNELCVFNLVPLDRESINEVSFVIEARDHGNLTSNITVVLTLDDVNDNSPNFIAAPLNISVFENETNGTVIANYQATDNDIGENADLTYSIQLTDSNIQHDLPFRIDPKNGSLYVDGSLDADNKETTGYAVIVKVTDNGSEKKYDEATVNIEVLDVNDNVPFFTSNIESVYTFSEGPTDRNSLILSFVVHDMDLNSQIDGTILSGNEFVNFGTKPAMLPDNSYIFSLAFIADLDYETTPDILVNVSFTDGVNTITSSLLINVTDVNDNQPYLNQTKFNVPETDLPGSVVIELGDYFRDNDSSTGNNNKLGGFIATENEYISVTIHGEIMVKMIDREEIPGGEITLDVTFFDQGDPQLSNTETITLIITDINDNSPIFDQTDQYRFQVYENEQAINFGRVYASDRDTGLNGKVIYEIIDSNLFTIDNVTGNLSCVEELDRERKDQYNITIVARDMGTPSRNTFITAVISVIDLNDNSPVFDEDINTQFVVDSDVPVGTVVSKFSASDRDEEINADIKYSLNDTSIFNINSSGDMFTVMELQEVHNDQIILLTASNNNNEDRNSSKVLLISINHNNITSEEETTLVPLYAVISGGVVLLLVGAILVVLCCICCLCYYRRHSKSRNLPPIPPQMMPPSKSNLKVTSFKEEDDAGYEGSVNGDMPRSPTVNFSDSYQVRYFSQDQSMAKSLSLKTETVRLEDKLSTEFVESPQIPTKDTTAPPEVEEAVSSPPLSEDLSSNSSLSNSVYHSTATNQYYEHPPKNQHMPLRIDTLKKHNEAISSGIYPQSHPGHDMLYGPPPQESYVNVSNGHYSHAINGDNFETLPPNIQHYLSSNHHSNQSISAPVSHYVSQNGSPPSADSSPSIQFISPDPRTNHRRLPHDKATSIPAVYYSNHHSHAPHEGTRSHPHYSMDQPPPSVYYTDPPPIQKGLQHYASSSSSSSNHRPDVSPPSPPQSSHYPPPPSSLVPSLHHHSSIPPSTSRHGRHSHDRPPLSPLDECPPHPIPPHSYSTHPRTHAPSYHPHPHFHHHGGHPSSHMYGNMSSRQSLAVSEDNSTVASSVLDTYLQFDTHMGKNDDYLLSDAISVDDR